MAGRVQRGVWLLLLAGMMAVIPASAQEHPWTLIANGILTSSSQIYYNPYSADPILRSQYLELSGFFGYGLELKYQIPESHVAFGLSVDRGNARNTAPLSGYLDQTIPVDDGYSVIPVELSGYFLIPISGNTFSLFMGGGTGVYFGKRIYAIGGTDADLVSTSPGFGIHVLAGASFRFTERLSVVGQMKFRDVQFESTNQFSATPILYEGTQIRVSRTPFTSSIHTDGIVFQLGLGVSF